MLTLPDSAGTRHEPFRSRPRCLFPDLPRPRRRPHQWRDIRHALARLGHAWHGRGQRAAGDADRIGRAEERRQRGGCGDCGKCGAGLDGAGIQRRRRRSVRDRLGRQDAKALRLQRLGPVAEIAHAEMVSGSRLQGDSAAWTAAGERTRLRGRLVRSARPLRQAEDEGRSRTRNRVRTRRLPGDAAHRVLLETLGAALEQISRVHRTDDAERPRAGGRRNLEKSESRQHA